MFSKEVIIIAILVSTVNPVVIRHHKIKTLEPNDAIRVFYSSPCSQLGQLLRDDGPRYATEYMNNAYGFKHSKAVTNICDKHYAQEWLGAIEELARCRQDVGIRMKRGVITTMQTINAATNMLKSFFTKGDAKEALDKVNRYNITTQIKLNIMRDVYHTTNISHINTDNSMMVTMQHMPMHVYGDYMAHQRIAICSHHLRRIAKMCRETNNLDVEALSELIDDQEVLRYQKTLTNITGITVDRVSNFFEIDFEGLIEIDQEEEINAEEVSDLIKPLILDRLTIIVCFILAFTAVLVVALCASFYCMIKCKRHEYHNNNARNDVWGTHQIETRT